MKSETYNLLVNIGRADIDAHLELELNAAGVPSYMHEGLCMYLRYGIRPGSFLVTVLENDLMGAVRNGDLTNQAALACYAIFLAQMPHLCYGSPDKVREWLIRGSETAAAARLAAPPVTDAEWS